MQNFTTTLHTDLVIKKRVFLPAGNAKFTLVDVRDIGKVAARIIKDYKMHGNRSYDLTSLKKFTFEEMVSRINTLLYTDIKYISPSLVNFFITKKREGTPAMLILVMIMLHYLPRFQDEPPISDCIQFITGNTPNSFNQFIEDNSQLLSSK